MINSSEAVHHSDFTGSAVSLSQMTEQAFDLAGKGVLSAVDLLNMVQGLAQGGQTERGIQLYRLWLEHTESPIAYAIQFNLGVMLANAQDDAGAVHAYRAAILHRPNFKEAYINLASLLERGKQFAEAIAVWRSLLTMVDLKVQDDRKLYMQALNSLTRLLELCNENPEIMVSVPINQVVMLPTEVHAGRDRLEKFDALSAGIIFVLWLGPYVMSEKRSAAVQSIFRDSGRPVCFITDATLHEWEHPDYPLHPAYRYLSEVHRADYLRCYLMHHYGGGYTDIKPVPQPWTTCFRLFNESDCLALGYPEISSTAVAQLPGELGDQLRTHYAELIGYCSMIFRRRSAITFEWMETTHHKLDELLPILQMHPAQHPMDQLGVRLPDGTVSQYPLQWTALGGNIFHPVILKYRQRVIKHTGIMPQLYDYR